VYGELIKPAVEAAGLEPLRADEEQVGGIIHKPMFELLILCEYAVADLTLFAQWSPKRWLSTEVLITVRQPSLSTGFVQLTERLCFHCIAVLTVGSIEHEIVAGEICGGSFLGLNRARFVGHFRPNRSDLFVQSCRDHLVGTLERFCVNRVDVSLIVYEPVPSFAALGATPFQVREPVRIEVQAYRGYESPLSPSVLLHR
jgi:hypothetical protein